MPSVPDVGVHGVAEIIHNLLPTSIEFPVSFIRAIGDHRGNRNDFSDPSEGLVVKAVVSAPATTIKTMTLEHVRGIEKGQPRSLRPGFPEDNVITHVGDPPPLHERCEMR